MEHQVLSADVNKRQQTPVNDVTNVSRMDAAEASHDAVKMTSS